ncbi:hypothetical protein [uncultured Rikenella sp.]|uniref:hypothetical protein n=1 Tax=uncultured Rikenella sp. TaxID=368003 RepID=UPI002630C6EB|nr:hypothetical protein [uncultured Rikenella sp.]
MKKREACLSVSEKQALVLRSMKYVQLHIDSGKKRLPLIGKAMMAVMAVVDMCVQNHIRCLDRPRQM